jgi:hypothetical protein
MKHLNRLTLLLSVSALLIMTACTKFTINNRCCNDEYVITNTKYDLPDSFRLFIPQAFTPNFDGINDIFVPKGTNYTIEHFEINRGRAVLYSSDKHLEAFWNGIDTRDGSEAKDGRYSYKMTLRLSNRDRLDVEGNVCIMRFGEVGDNLYESERNQICDCLMGDMIDARKGIVSETPECPTNGYTD